VKLHLGVLDEPYVDNDGLTTGDVAELLEAKYHVQEICFQENEQAIADALTSGIEGQLENLLMGQGGVTLESVMNAGTPKVDEIMKDFIANGEMERLGYPGVPTKAAILRKSGRFKKKRGPAQRPSFIDTGHYQATQKSWVDNE